MEIESPVILERAMGIEPTYSAWKAAALPLCYARILLSNQKVLALYTSFKLLSRVILNTLPANLSEIKNKLVFYLYLCQMKE